MKSFLGNLRAPLILMFYGFFLVVIQVILIRFLVFLGIECGHSVLVQVLMILFYLSLNTALLYSWYKLTKYIRNKELLK
ncbi:MAG: hypothetical protein QN229_01580 [Desulfurococcaceae archaeon TW002]